MIKDYWADVPESTTGEYVQKTAYEIIPDGTVVLAHIEEIKWNSFPGSDHLNVNIRWVIDEPEEYLDRKFFQTIKVNGEDPKSQYYKESANEKIIESAMGMLFAIDRNAGGELSKIRRKPTDAELNTFYRTVQMMVTLGVTKGGKQYVHAVSPNPKGNGEPVRCDAFSSAANANPYAYKDETGFDESQIPF